MAATEEDIPSPCNDKCEMDDRDICTGCFRSLEEIVKWTRVDTKTRDIYWQKIALRRKLHLENESRQ
jgi:uncharacterized protein